MIRDTLQRTRFDGETIRAIGRSMLCIIIVLSLVAAPAASQTETETTPCELGPPTPAGGGLGGQVETTTESEVGFVLDASNSMSNAGLFDDQNTFAKGVIGTLNGSDSEVSVSSWARTAKLDEELTRDYDRVNNTIDGLTTGFGTLPPDGVNGFGDSINLTREELISGTNATPSVPNVMIIITDAQSNNFQDTDQISVAAENAKDAGITIISISVGENADHDEVRQLASRDELYYNASEITDLPTFVEQVSEDAGDAGVEGSGLRIDTRQLFTPGSTHDYRVSNVTFTVVNNQTDRTAEDVTAQATVTSSNTSVLSVDNQDNTLTASSDTNTSTWVRLDATYNGLTGCTNVIVAQQSVENLELLPGIHRWSATLTDSTIYFLIAVMLTGIVATRYSNAFGGLSLMQAGILIGWFGGYVGLGIAMVSIFLTLFIGFNLAVNIDYTMGYR